MPDGTRRLVNKLLPEDNKEVFDSVQNKNCMVPGSSGNVGVDRNFLRYKISLLNDSPTSRDEWVAIRITSWKHGVAELIQRWPRCGVEHLWLWSSTDLDLRDCSMDDELDEMLLGQLLTGLSGQEVS
ncbi:uncharacterized protein PGTG_01360 [Puccinia graminis f. sp. tritici CRL 75-36-700-3]|uniref:Uncharacterized protein n=1 Tax=Puccinia graminis f. sp. tritici (strain CRL 75-36-700-3 / race SCCL) TaxID=418459 RepID=E3JVF4_PUCGT|nr:uncharacterized protein PGTG_01360 [Puccinia graminis f. sp. tritici CRL 75-36-700-3]EFP76029.1 hypothetical protein PGTG_01360 [Puccinia graminis f. sp. tritici CRL 75-36-700-3]